MIIEKCQKGELYDYLTEQGSLNEYDTALIIR